VFLLILRGINVLADLRFQSKRVLISSQGRLPVIAHGRPLEGWKSRSKKGSIEMRRGEAFGLSSLRLRKQSS